MATSDATEGTPPDSLVPHLLISKGPQRGKIIPLDSARLQEKPLVLGRLKGEAEVILQTYQNKVSRKHAQILYRAEDELFLVQDVGSSNGTLLNGDFIAIATPLFPGDTITCGDVELVFVVPIEHSGLPLARLPGQTGRECIEDTLPGVARLEVVSTEVPYLRLGSIIRLTPQHLFTIGRLSENDLQLLEQDEEKAKLVSRRHAGIRWSNGSYIIVDRGAANPTWVNRSQIDSFSRLEDQDSIQVGSTLLRYRAPRLPLEEKSKAPAGGPERAPGLRFVARRNLELGPAQLILPVDRQVLIGRDEGNDLQLFDRSVSRRHAKLFYEAQRFLLVDLGSTNGTVLNRQVIGSPVFLQPGDRVQLGDFEFVFEELALTSPNGHSNGHAAEQIVKLSEPVMLKLGSGEGVLAEDEADKEAGSPQLTEAAAPPINHPLRGIPPFDELDSDTFKLLMPHFKEVSYKPGQEMVREGQNRGAFFAILEGKVQISRTLNEREKGGQRIVLGEIGPGSVYGERSIFADQPFANRLEAVTPVRALRLEEATFVRDLSRNRSVLTFFQQQVSAASATNWMKASLLMRTLSDKTRNEMAKRLRYRVWSAGETIIQSGQSAEDFFLVLGGVAKAFGMDSRKREVALATLEEGDNFGEEIVAAGETYRMTVRAETMVECYALSRADFESVLAKSGDPVGSIVPGVGGIPVSAVLNRVSPFMTMPPQLVAKIAAEMRPKFFKKGEIIVSQDEPASAFYIIGTGQVEVSFKTSEGEERPDMRLGPGKYFGEDAVLTNVPRPVTVKAIEDCELLALYRNKLEEVLKLGESYDLSQYFVKQLRLRFRPKRVAGVSISEHTTNTGEHYYLLSRTGGEQFFRLSDRSYFLWNLMNGDNSLNDLSMAFFLEFKALDLEGASNLVGQLQAGGFLEVPAVDESLVSPDKQKPHFYQRIFNWRYEFKGMDRFFDRLYNYGGQVFFWKPVLFLLFAIIILGFGAFLYFGFLDSVNAGGAFGLMTTRASLPWAWVWALIPSIVLHELAHGLACKSYGRAVIGGGFGWQSGPFFFVNTNEIWREKRGPRIVVNLAGPLCNALLAGACCLLMFLAPNNQELQASLFQIALIGYVLVYININPLLETDGYYALMDWWDTPGLRLKAFNYIRRVLFKHAQGRTVADREKRIYWSYARLCVAYIFFTLVQYLFIIKIMLSYGLSNLLNISNEGLSWGATVVILVILTWPLIASALAARRNEEELE
jgi:CRP-like cAMP-binding protein/pSer/pThr/pTyr-binding forkhead associated (FHA) protein